MNPQVKTVQKGLLQTIQNINKKAGKTGYNLFMQLATNFKMYICIVLFFFLIVIRDLLLYFSKIWSYESEKCCSDYFYRYGEYDSKQWGHIVYKQ